MYQVCTGGQMEQEMSLGTSRRGDQHPPWSHEEVTAWKCPYSSYQGGVHTGKLNRRRERKDCCGCTRA